MGWVPSFVAEFMMGRGYGALKASQPEQALRWAKRLDRLRHTSSYEIEARARWMQEDREGAIAILRKGLKAAPGVYVLWDYLGTYLSDEGYYGDAIEALQKGRSCPRSQVEMFDYNIAVVLRRQGRFQEALDLLETIPTSSQLEFLVQARADALNMLGRYQEAFVVADEAIRADHDDSALLAERAHANFYLGNQAGAKDDALRAIELDKTCGKAPQVLRLVHNEQSNASHRWRVRVNGRSEWIPIYGKTHRFGCTYLVIADDPNRSLEWIRPFERKSDRASLSITQCEDLGPAADELMGVERAFDGYTLFPLSTKSSKL